MNNNFHKKLAQYPPVMVFGVGGSGTRVVSEILNNSGCFMGNNLNSALDNMDFAFLLSGRVRWMEKHFPFTNYNKVRIYFDIFNKIYFKEKLTFFNLMVMAKILFEYLVGVNRKQLTNNPIKERFKSGKNLFKPRSLDQNIFPESFEKWGFKSPPGMYFINPLLECYPGIKLIHVLRDGRDIALSKMRKPLYYKHIFNISSSNAILDSFYNWCAVNRWVKNICVKQLPPNRYLTIKYEDICTKPKESVNRIIEFAELLPKNLNNVYRIPRNNPSIGRWTKHKELFQSIDLEILREFRYM